MTSRTGRPIVVADYDPQWVRRFQEERAMIYRACGRDAFVRIEHVGSTAVPGLAAKPIVDIMPGVRSLDAFMAHVSAIEAMGYQYVPEYEKPIPELNDPGMPFRRYFRKDVDGVRAFHMHTVEAGSDFWRDHLLFRNYLRTNPHEAGAYAALKRRLADTYNATMLADNVNVNVGYTDFKTEFVERIKSEARARVARSTPVLIVPYNDLWPVRYAQLREQIVIAIGNVAVDIRHVGSSSVPGVAAKPTIDVAIGVRTMAEGRAADGPLHALGYTKGVEHFPDWRYYDIEDHARGENVHLHMVPYGGDRWNRYLLFRDELCRHAGLAAAYENLKRELAVEFGRDRLGYVESKTEFVEAVLSRVTKPVAP
jgi:GrpB-like predicted nucleotidyltransferase (UPF0157 family)